MKKRILVISLIFFIILLLPRVDLQKDGGTKEFTSLLYKVTKYHRIESFNNGKVLYNDGLKIEILGITIYDNFNGNNSESSDFMISSDFEIKTIEKLNCKNEYDTYYDKEDVSIYTICIDNILLKDNNKLYQLKDVLSVDLNVMDLLISKLDFNTSFDDGSSVYKNNNLTILKCNTSNGNNDVYIGTDLFNPGLDLCNNIN